MDLLIDIDGVSRTIAVAPHPDGGWWVTVGDGDRQHVTGTAFGDGEWALRIGGERHVFGANVDGSRVDLQLGGRAWQARALDARTAALQLGAGAGEGVVATQMPGVIVRVLVAEGDTVAEGDPIVVVEAMKMENEFKAPIDGTVAAIHVEAGTNVDSGAALVTIEPG